MCYNNFITGLIKTVEEKVEEQKSSDLSYDVIKDIILEALIKQEEELPHLRELPEILKSGFKITINGQKQEINVHDIANELAGEDKKKPEKTLLYYAVERYDKKLIEKLLNAGFKESKLKNKALERAIQLLNDSNTHVKTIQDIIRTFYSKSNVESPKREDILESISSKNNALLEVYIELNNNISSMINEIPKGKKSDLYSIFHHAVLKSSIETIKYILDKGGDINIKTKDGETALELARKRKDPEKEKVTSYLEIRENFFKTRRNYQIELFKLDASIIKKISDTFNSILEIYKKSNNFSSNYSLVKEDIYRMDQLSDDLLRQFNPINYYTDNQFELKILVYLKQIAKYVDLLGNHDKSIKNKSSIIPWDLLKSFPEILSKKIEQSRDFLEQRKKISPDIMELSANIIKFINSYTKENEINFDQFEEINEPQELVPIKLKNLYEITFVANNLKENIVIYKIYRNN